MKKQETYQAEVEYSDDYRLILHQKKAAYPIGTVVRTTDGMNLVRNRSRIGWEGPYKTGELPKE